MPVVLLPQMGTANPMRPAKAPPVVMGSTTGRFGCSVEGGGGDDQNGTVALLLAARRGIEGDEVDIVAVHSSSRRRLLFEMVMRGEGIRGTMDCVDARRDQACQASCSIQSWRRLADRQQVSTARICAMASATTAFTTR